MTNLSEAIALMKRLLKESSQSADFDETHEQDNVIHVRYWGSWQVPDGEEDDGDYDWQELTENSFKQLMLIKERVETAFPDVRIAVSTSEKNWLSATATER